MTSSLDAHQRTIDLFADWCRATGRDRFPDDPASIDAFFAQVPVRAVTRNARTTMLRADYQAAHRQFPVPHSPTASAVRSGDGWLTVTEAVRRCPTTSLLGVAGRRDALVLVLLDAGAIRHEVRRLTPDAVDVLGWRVARFPVPVSDSPATCPRCVLTRWLALAATLPPHGWRGETQEVVFTPPPDGHDCAAEVDPRWRRTAHLIPSIDRHGWTGYTPLSRRYISRIVATRMSVTAPDWVNSVTVAGAPAEPEATPPPRVPLPVTTWQRTDLKPVTDELDALLDRLDREAGALADQIGHMLDG